MDGWDDPLARARRGVRCALLLQTMVDANGDGSITEQEFLSAAKECMVAERAAKERNNAEVLDVLRRMSSFLTTNPVRRRKPLSAFRVARVACWLAQHHFAVQGCFFGGGCAIEELSCAASCKQVCCMTAEGEGEGGCVTSRHQRPVGVGAWFCFPSQARAQQLFSRYSTRPDAALEPADLAAFFRAALQPAPSMHELRLLLMHMSR